MADAEMPIAEWEEKRLLLLQAGPLIRLLKAHGLSSQHAKKSTMVERLMAFKEARSAAPAAGASLSLIPLPPPLCAVTAVTAGGG